ncbi:DUF1523 family protein [Paracoccus sp. (in: a-proteobacteria)]|uniref:DUF1523 family protein n=1 Tax=Paracoccus sp. TaxID=267 RepID=UPI0026E08B97|nr:DUF1523 family protein [Paracoccus sp. (in: a-proteobacteria)]MDO5646898.1 DUF1523 family protein [Paracoccus sp. (in: a-proteobacteria)]
MLRYAKLVIGVLFGVFIFALLDYALPSKKTVRISDTYNRLTTVTTSNAMFWASTGGGTAQTPAGQRDVFFIDTVRPNGRVFVYRNEDTGWVWPPYFKYNSSNLHAEATTLKSTPSEPIWVSVTAYGWRMPWLSTYPNAVSISVVSGPDDRPTNWGALIVCGVMLMLLALIWRMWAQFRERAAVRLNRWRS